MDDHYVGLGSADAVAFQRIDVRGLVSEVILAVTDPHRVFAGARNEYPSSAGAPLYWPDSHFLNRLQSGRHVLLKPIQLTASVAGGALFVSDDEFHCWGSGATLAEAVADYETNLIETYEDLIDSEEPLSRLAEETLGVLRDHVLRHQE